MSTAALPDGAAPVTIESIGLEDIRSDGGTRVRDIDPDTVASYGEAYSMKASMPPVVVFYDEEEDANWLADGFHRVEALRLAGVRRALAEVHIGSLRDALLFACGANHSHGRPRSHEDKRRVVLTLLKDEEWSTWNDSKIARRCNVSHTFVAKVRKHFTCNASSERRYLTKHGRVAIMNTSRIGRGARAPAPEGVVEDWREDETARDAVDVRSTSRSRPEDDGGREIRVRYRNGVALVPVDRLLGVLNDRRTGSLRLDFSFEEGLASCLRITWVDDADPPAEERAP